jgi:preprotein translocase subunit SecA
VPPPRYRQFGSDQQKEAVDNSMGHSGGSYLQQGPAYDFAPKVGRNEPCPCGSGRKFKRCCGRMEMEG